MSSDAASHEPSLKVGVLHPGAMGVAIAQSVIDSGRHVCWASAGRRSQTRERADRGGLTDVGTIDRLAAECAVILSVCPPEFASDVAAAVAATGFTGVFADLNAIAPQRKIAMATAMRDRGIRFADGGIIGLPTRTPGETTVFLSGEAAPDVARCLANGAIGATVLDGEPGRASALKILFAAHNKGSIALLTSLYAAARQYGVLDELQGQFAQRGVALAKIETQIVRAAPKAWRWIAEMHEISAALEAVNLPGDFHQAAAVVYERLAGFKDAENVELADVIATAGQERRSDRLH
jgi:3-hydroxyisobutyrate dehydrogenase-like beta-hydroxyacid dehydrogenase